MWKRCKLFWLAAKKTDTYPAYKPEVISEPVNNRDANAINSAIS